jgi:hypothetical protein
MSCACNAGFGWLAGWLTEYTRIALRNSSVI